MPLGEYCMDIKRITISVSFVLGVLVSTRLALAQTALPVISETPEATASASVAAELATEQTETETTVTVNGVTVARPLVLTQEQEAVREQYRAAIEQYQRSYREYTLAKAQYQQLDTLVALEKAVVATRAAMADRAEVLLTFFDLLHVELRATAGVDPEKKQAALREIESLRAEFLASKEAILASNDRAALLDRAVEYAQTTQGLEENAYYVRSLLLSGKLYWGYLQSLSMYQEIKDQQGQDQSNSLRQAQITRAYAEIDQLIGQINTKWDAVAVKFTKEEDKKRTWYQQVITLLTDLQTDILRLYSYLEEVNTL